MVGQAPGPRRIHSTRSPADARASYCPGRLADRARPRHHPPEVHLSGGNLFTLTVIRPAWAYRVELAGIAVLAWLFWWLTGEVGDRRRAGVILAATALLMLVPPVRNRLATVLHRSHLRRRWTLACRHAELATVNDRVPRITGGRFVPSGDLLRVRMPAGRPVEDLEHAAETAAAFLEVREVRWPATRQRPLCPRGRGPA